MKHNFRASKNLSQLQHQRRATRVAATVSTVSSFNQLQRIFSPRDFAGCLDMWVDRDRHIVIEVVEDYSRPVLLHSLLGQHHKTHQFFAT
jgi:hypothetical protein